MEPKFIQLNFANFVTINLIVLTFGAILVLGMRYLKSKQTGA